MSSPTGVVDLSLPDYSTLIARAEVNHQPGRAAATGSPRPGPPGKAIGGGLMKAAEGVAGLFD